MNELLNSLTEAEFLLVRETEPEHLAQLDEDGLLELHRRVRRARNKFSKSYRRQASLNVAKQGGRGKARPKNTRNAQKAEIFEESLARVSRSLATAARRSAAQMKSERIAAARAGRGVAPRRAPQAPDSTRAKPQRSQRVPASAPAVRKRHASTAAVGARRQARSDSR